MLYKLVLFCFFETLKNGGKNGAQGAEQTTQPAMTESLQNEISVASTDYAKYFDFSSLHSSQHGAVHETIEQLLTELDELNALVQTVRQMIFIHVNCSGSNQSKQYTSTACPVVVSSEAIRKNFLVYRHA